MHKSAGMLAACDEGPISLGKSPGENSLVPSSLLMSGRVRWEHQLLRAQSSLVRGGIEPNVQNQMCWEAFPDQ